MGLAISFEDWISQPHQHDVWVKRPAGVADIDRVIELLSERIDFV